MSIAGHVSIEMLRHYSHIRQEAKRKAVTALDNDTITSQLEKWKKNADDEHPHKLLRSNTLLVGTGRFELPTPRTPSGLAVFSAVSRHLPRCALESVFMRLSAHYRAARITVVYC
jgi:hypothetical protein